MLPNPYSRYQSVAVETASPGQLILMLYDGAIRFGVGAIKAFQEERTEEGLQLVARIKAIIDELTSSLNHQQGGDIAVSLYRMYEYMGYRLIQVQFKPSPEPVEEVVNLLRDLRSAWAEVVQGPSAAAKGEEGAS